ncbi:MAG: 2-phosphosulfolactate phosphatase [Ignavibacteria bacterium]|jgi:2-phosphosulfolactate phosphatase|nr:2-phosphosulfolactate phosphatase [Ignavibacteria bacterium]MDH7527264.1 2-phosphosulfolactate phosphatase [Ignavibacteria bacterium]
MKVEVIFLPNEKMEDYFFQKNVIVVDLLRATSTIITALANGAKNIIPTSSVEEAVKIAKNFERSTYLLCGEKNTKIIEGFDLGNSPLEFTNEKVKDKKIILTTTNGTKVFSLLKHSQNVLIYSTLNLSAVVQKMLNLGDEWFIICSGRNGFYDATDAIAAGLLLHKLNETKTNLEVNDAGLTSLVIYEKYKNDLRKFLKETDHGQILIQNGFEVDIDFISQIDKYNINASYSNNFIGLL